MARVVGAGVQGGTPALLFPLEIKPMKNLTTEQLTDLLEKAHRVVEASIRVMRDDPDDLLSWAEYDSAYLAYDAARDVVRDAQRRQSQS